MSLHLEFEPHSWYMGFAIRKQVNEISNKQTWGAYTDDGNTYQIVEIEAMHLNTLKRHIRQYHLKKHNGYGERIAKKRLEYLRGEIAKERISYGEVAELQSLTDYIENDDVELLEWAGVPEGAR